MACGEFGPGRLPEPEMIWLEIADMLGLDPGVLGIGGASSQVIEDYLEALEPEDEEEEVVEAEEDAAPARGGLSGLLASIITRSTPRRIMEEEVEFDDLPEFAPIQPDVDPEIVPDLSNPLLAVKGKAIAAPPTDPEALNHEVRGGGAPARADPGR